MSLNCKICGKENPKHLFRCENHYRCDGCGTKENIVYRIGGLTCDSCHAERAEKQVKAFNGDTDYTSEITCPWCGYEQMDSWEASDAAEHVCDNCGNEYSHIRDVEVTYCTTKIEGSDNQQLHPTSG